MNFIHLAGRLGKDAEQRVTANGRKVIELLVVTNTFKNGKEEAIWWRVTLWGDRHDKMVPYLTKGKPIMVGGELRGKPEIYTDKSGQPQVSSLEVTGEYVKFFPFGGRSEEGSQQKQESTSSDNPLEGIEMGMGEEMSDQPEEEPLPF